MIPGMSAKLRKKNLESESWSKIPFFRGYEVSRCGRVRSLRRSKPKILRLATTTSGYLRVSMRRGKQSRNRMVHRLVAQAFLTPCEGKTHVNHKDGNKQNNNVDNLEWVTNSDNVKHAWRIGLHDRRRAGG